MSRRIPYSDTRPDEWEATTAGRISCESCGEWIYPQRRRGSDEPYALPTECPVCGAALDRHTKDTTR